MVSTNRLVSLQAAFTIADDVANQETPRLFWAIDRLWADRDTVNDDDRSLRSEATNRMAAELDRRNVPIRPYDVEAEAIEKIRAEITDLAA